MNRHRTMVLAAALVLTFACSPLAGLPGRGDAVVADALWPDVPAFPGAQRVEVELPLVVRVAVEAASQAMVSQAGEGLADMEFISYTTGQPMSEVTAFYSLERMAAEGWTEGEDVGCTSETSGDFGGMCIYLKETTDLASALFIVVGQESGQTTIFYFRLDADPSAIAD